jgi:hypothetical protein
LLSFADVQERLVEAWGFLRRMPDREAAWINGAGVSSLWRQVRLSRQELWQLYQFNGDDYDPDVLPRPQPLRAAEVDRMWSTLAWVEWVPERDRRLLGAALARLDRGDAQVPWRDLAGRLGWGGHPDALRKRYDRAIARIAARVNRGVPPVVRR